MLFGMSELKECSIIRENEIFIWNWVWEIFFFEFLIFFPLCMYVCACVLLAELYQFWREQINQVVLR